jgi:hypothetical protein
MVFMPRVIWGAKCQSPDFAKKWGFNTSAEATCDDALLVLKPINYEKTDHPDFAVFDPRRHVSDLLRVGQACGCFDDDNHA